jgi:integrase/DNA-binding CsgD family transcriptional regulator
MRYHAFPELDRAYLDEHLKGKPSYTNQLNAAKPWLLTLLTMPTRKQIRERHRLRGHGDYEAGAASANNELKILRAAIRWALDNEHWDGHDPTVGVKKWKTAKRKRVSKAEELKQLLQYFGRAHTAREIRDRALFGLMLFTGCRPGEARKARLGSITPYGAMGCWTKGQTKNGESYEVPVPKQYMPWLAAWLAIRPSARPNPYLFPGQGFMGPLNDDRIGNCWRDLRGLLGLRSLWNYDLRRSLATHLSNELNYSDAKIDAILGHEKTSSLGHYLHVSFDAMCEPIQRYADWLWALLPSRPVRAPCMAADEEDTKRLRSLSEREYEALACFAHGLSCTAIAAHLGIAIKTVTNYRARLVDKLHLTNTTVLLRYAMAHQADMPLPISVQSTPLPVLPRLL